MGGMYDYALLDFTASLSKVEMNFSENLQSIIDTFSNSRLDLPLKRLGEIAKVHARAARNLKKMLDPKLNEHLNLWKMCNIYSAISVDLDKAMRETRSFLRTKMQIDGTVIEKTKKKNILDNLFTPRNAEQEEKTHWLKRFSKEERARKQEARLSRKNTITSLDMEKDNCGGEDIHKSKSTPPTPPSIRTVPLLKSSASFAPNTYKKPAPPPRPVPLSTASSYESINTTSSSIHQISTEPSAPPPIPTSAIPQEITLKTPASTTYAPTIYGELQKSALMTENQKRIIEEHSLRHTDDIRRDISVVKIRTNVEVEKDSSRNETTVNVFDNSKNQYVNIRPPIAQKPKVFPVESPRSAELQVNPSKTSPLIVRMRSYDVHSNDRVIPPTMISVDCPVQPTPSPRTYFTSIDTPASSSQRSSSSAYSSNYSSSSSSTNVTTFNIDGNSRPTSEVEHARLIRIDSPDARINRF